jgi:hypothetical protein
MKQIWMTRSKYVLLFRYVVGDQLVLPRSASTAGRQGLVPPLVELLVVLSDPQTWESALGANAARKAAEVCP